jgi:hypothetical protein
MKKLIIILLICLSIFVFPCIADYGEYYNSADISLTANNYKNITFNSEYFDQDNLHDISTNSERVTAQNTGIYIISCDLDFQTHETVNNQIALVKNGVTRILAGSAKGAYSMTVSDIVYLNATEYIYLKAYSSVDNKILATTRGPRLTIYKVNQTSSSGSESMTTDQFNLLFALLAMCAIFVAIIGTIKIWHFIGGDGQ